MTVSFRNKGLLDLVALKTFGVSAKESENPVGYFGTGLKYALAIVLRSGGSVVLWLGEERHEFSAREVEVRGQPFQLVQLDGQDLGFTTDVGKEWKPWMAYRELYCNAKDEPEGEATPGQLPPQPGYTTLWVEGLDECLEAHDTVILSGEPRWRSIGIEVHDQPRQHLFARGIRVLDLPQPARFTYNVIRPRVTLTEDRTAKDVWQVISNLARAVLQSEDPDFIQAVVTAEPDTFEQRLDLDFPWTPGPVFMQVMEDTPFKRITNPTALKKFNRQRRDRMEPKPVKLTEMEQMQLERAHRFVEEVLGHDTRSDRPKFTDDLQEGTLAMVYDGDVYISRRAFMLGTKVVAHALYEEHIHKHYGYYDCTRDMQNYLFEVIMSLGEQVRGEPI